LAAQPGSPAGTVEVVQKLVGGGGSASAPVAAGEPKLESAANGVNGTEATAEDIVQANTAAQVADTAEKLDSNEAKPVTA